MLPVPVYTILVFLLILGEILSLVTWFRRNVSRESAREVIALSLLWLVFYLQLLPPETDMRYGPLILLFCGLRMWYWYRQYWKPVG